MRTICVLLLALSGGVAFAADNEARIAALANPPARNWDVVESITAAAEAAPTSALPGRYSGEMQDLLLAPDGRMATVFNARGIEQMEEHGGSARGMATIGRWKLDGEWLALVAEDFAQAPAGPATPEQIADFRENLTNYFEDMSEDEALDAYEAMTKAVGDDRGEGYRSAYGQSGEDNRMLVVDGPDGTLLVDGSLLLWQAQRWPGEGGLDITAGYWRASGPASAYAQPREEAAQFTLPDPMHASVPHALRKLLRPQVIETRVLGRVDADQPIAWDAHQAQLRLRLDRGEDDGLLAGMYLYGVPPHENLYATLESVSAKESVATLNISRFAPTDPPAVPAKGVVFASRTAGAIGCGFDTRAAVRAAITAVREPAGGAKRDADGYAFVELDIDQGAYHGLALEDAFNLEGGGIEGEGRVRKLGDTTATVLWRAEPDWAAAFAQGEDDADEDDAEAEKGKSEGDDGDGDEIPGLAAAPLVLPAPGQHLVTPSWESAERDLFGKADAPSSPVIVD